MVKIRLRRVGAKKQPSYRVVVADSRAPRDGRFIEVIGFYNPRTEPGTVEIKEDRALHWLSVGAQPTESVAQLLDQNGTLARFERLKQGESVEDLVAEAEAQAGPEISPKTRPQPAQPAEEEAEPEEEAEEAEEEAEAEAAEEAEEEEPAEEEEEEPAEEEEKEEEDEEEEEEEED